MASLSYNQQQQQVQQQQPESTSSHLIKIMQQNYQENEKFFVIFLTFLSVTAYYPVIVALTKLHKNRGFDIILNLMTVIAQIMYKITLVFQYNEIFISEQGWYKMLNISMLLQFCSLMIYLARIPKELRGYLMGVGTIVILLAQEKDSQSFKYALIPLIFNNFFMISSQCFLQGPVYVNTRMVVFGAIWYIISIIAFVGQYHKFLDFFLFFQDLTIFSTGLSLFYSWQTYEKNDITFENFIQLHADQYRELMDQKRRRQNESRLEESELGNLKRLEEKSNRKQEAKKQQKLKQMKMGTGDEESGILLELNPSPKRDIENGLKQGMLKTV
ncbi:UNKNOWN [Stylonychia lemnae]|uniref:Transmembrane protein n=1 Tax=Stylonychia lemnae TaxID=5949 RepID=A0A078B6C0_STYLE|nr:UNKNOWN [Stylonychia lemnae]|eukprot:CDW89904.1 UNKNOWN [Stylonychia lemnae]